MRANVYFFRLLTLQSVLFVWLQLEQREKKAAQKAARVGQQKALLADEEEAVDGALVDHAHGVVDLRPRSQTLNPARGEGKRAGSYTPKWHFLARAAARHKRTIFA